MNIENENTIFDCIDTDDILNVLDRLFDVYEDTRPRIIKRKYKKRNKRYFGRPILVYNSIHDILDFNLSMSTKLIKNCLNKEMD